MKFSITIPDWLQMYRIDPPASAHAYFLPLSTNHHVQIDLALPDRVIKAASLPEIPGSTGLCSFLLSSIAPLFSSFLLFSPILLHLLFLSVYPPVPHFPLFWSWLTVSLSRPPFVRSTI